MGKAIVPVNHIYLDEQGQAWIAGTSYRVIDVAVDHVFHGFSPSEIQYQHYGELSLGQVHAALAYYFDHQVELDKTIKSEEALVEKILQKPEGSPIVKRLKAEGKLP